MKVENINKYINETVHKKMKMDEDSHFEGHNFVTNGRDINLLDIDMPLVKINKDTVLIKWTGKLEMHNNGVYGFDIEVKSMNAESEEDKDSEVQKSPLNFNGFEYVIKKRKNAELPEVQVFIESVYVSTQEKKIYVEFII